MPISIVIPEMEEYPLMDEWIKDTKEVFLKILNNEAGGVKYLAGKGRVSALPRAIVEYLHRYYPLSLNDLERIKIQVEFDYSKNSY